MSFCLKHHLPLNNSKSVLLRDDLVDVRLQVGKGLHQLVLDALLDAGLELHDAGDAGVFESESRKSSIKN